jgi:hypothetical protein
MLVEAQVYSSGWWVSKAANQYLDWQVVFCLVDHKASSVSDRGGKRSISDT